MILKAHKMLRLCSNEIKINLKFSFFKVNTLKKNIHFTVKFWQLGRQFKIVKLTAINRKISRFNSAE